MRNLLSKYRRSKFRCFINGLLFAMLSLAAMFLCVYFLRDKTSSDFEVLVPFGLSVLCMLLGFVSMFRTVPGAN